jgi:Domain of unknown function (DUF4105)
LALAAAKLPTIPITVLLSLLTLWATAALYLDLRPASWRVAAAAGYFLTVVTIFAAVGAFWPRTLLSFLAFVSVLLWWLSIKASNERMWQADVERTAWAELDGDLVIIHNYRRCEYRSEFDYACNWLDKPVYLSQIRGIDLFVVYWGSQLIAHPITSFQIGDHDHVCFSIETRKERDERYSPIRGFFRSYELIYTVAPESDLVQLRSNFRKGAHGQGEEVYLYRTTAGPAWSRVLFLAYVSRINELHRKAEWYNAIASNCTTNIFTERAAADASVHVPTAPLKKLLHKFDWRILLNGKGDKMEFQRGDLVTGGLGFDALKRQAYINPAARKNPGAQQFSERIREGRVGF